MTAPLAAHVGEAVQILCDPGLSSQLGTLQGQGLARIWDFCSRGGNWTFLVTSCRAQITVQATRAPPSSRIRGAPTRGFGG